MTPRQSRLLAALAATSLLLAACSRGPEEGEEVDTTDGGTATTSADAGGAAPTTAAETETTEASEDTAVETTTADTEGGETTEGGGGGGAEWTVSTDDCIDPDLANSPIEGTVSIGSSMPLSGGVAATAFGPVAEGFRAYVEYANEQGLLPEHEVSLNDRRRPVRRRPDTERRQRPARLGGEPVQRHHRHAEQRRRARRPQRGVRAADARSHGLAGVGRGRRLSVDHGRADPLQHRGGGVRPAHRRAVPRRRDRRVVHGGQRVRRGVPHGVRGGGRGSRHRDRRRADHRGCRQRSSFGSAQQHRRQPAGRHHGGPTRRPVPDVHVRTGQRQGGPVRVGSAGVHHEHVRQPADPGRGWRGSQRL